MQYIKKWISTLASVNFYSSSDQLDDHLNPSYLQFVTDDTMSMKQATFCGQEQAAAQYLVGESKRTKSSSAKMNNSYP